MAADKLIWVVATQRGQGPDMKWRDENSPAFQVKASKFTKVWMKRVSEEDAKALDEQKAKDDLAKATPEQAALMQAEAETEALKGELDKANAKIAELQAELDKANSAGNKPAATPAKDPPAKPPETKSIAEKAKE